MSLSLAENVIVVGADNRPPMLDKTQYNSWASRMLLYIKGKENGKLLVDSVLNVPYKYRTITEVGTATTPATERESRLYDEFDMFTSVPGEIINLYYLRSNAITREVNRTGGTNTSGQEKVIHCDNYQKEGHMARQCTKPKRPRTSTWFKEKAMLAEDLKPGVILNEERMAFLADNGDTVTTSQ
uniref:Uncharacterized protein n=1 Tax=Tanacetum cinerariifolium TaxID=118510 RepID=A0A6L2P4A6_TANCI|nr:hypothetical protein [Tanacetum cinerariifolium]